MQLIEAYLESSWEYRASQREGYLHQLVGEYSQRAEDAIQQLSTVVVSFCTVSVICVGAANQPARRRSGPPSAWWR